MNQPFPVPSSEPVCDHAPARGGSFTEINAFRTIFEESLYGKVIVDDTGLIAEVNKRALSLFGYEREEMIGSPIKMLVPTRHREEHVAHRSEFSGSDTARQMAAQQDVTGQRKDGLEFPLEISLTPIGTEHGRMICASIIDTTKRERTERYLRDVNAQLEEFTYVASHDLRSPIRGISNLIDFMREDFEDGEIDAMMKSLDRIQNRLHALERLIDDLLSYARAGRRSAPLEEVSMGDVMTEISTVEQIPDGIALKIDVSEDTFQAARTPLTTVLRNLISNAVKHHDKDQGTISVTSSVDDDIVQIDVCDDGPGIPENAHERVFRLFQTINGTSKQNAGLGLAIAQRLATSHGGRIELPSSLAPRGTRFRVSWPRFERTDLNV